MSGPSITRREALSRTARLGVGAAALGPLSALARLGLDGRDEPPNIVFIFSDDHACPAISAYGSVINRTPHIDRLADEGAIFLNSFCTNSICAPSRAVVLTGKHSHANGKIDNSRPFDMSQPTVNRMLQAAGYQTALIGKWHLGVDPEGFDHWEILPGQGHYYNPDFRTAAGDRRYEGYVSEIITELTLEWLDRGRDPSRPLLLMCQHKAPHRNWMPGPDYLDLYEDETIPEPATLFDDYAGRASPAADTEMTLADHMLPAYDLKLTPPAEEDETDRRLWGRVFDRLTDEQKARWHAAYDPRNEAFRAAGYEGRERVRAIYQRYIKDYLRCVASVDDSVGRVLDWIDASGLADNTLVVYSSDQGFYLGEHGWYDKRWMYEESLRMPFLARWPRRIRPGTRVSGLIQNIDYAPTFLEVAGREVPADMHGASLVPLLDGGAPHSWRRSIYYHYYEYPQPHRVAPHYGVRTERYKLVRYERTDEWELFDLERDPQELRSVYDDPAYTGVRAELEEELRRLRAQYGDTASAGSAG